MDNLKEAHRNARKGKGWYAEVKEVDTHLEEYLTKLQKMLVNHTYHTSPYEVHKERKRKGAGNLQTPLLPGSYLSMGDFASH